MLRSDSPRNSCAWTCAMNQCDVDADSILRIKRSLIVAVTAMLFICASERCVGATTSSVVGAKRNLLFRDDFVAFDQQVNDLCGDDARKTINAKANRRVSRACCCVTTSVALRIVLDARA